MSQRDSNVNKAQNNNNNESFHHFKLYGPSQNLMWPLTMCVRGKALKFYLYEMEHRDHGW